MPDQPPDTVTVTIDAKDDQRTLDLVRELDESVAELIPVSINAMREGRCPKEVIETLDSFADTMESVGIGLEGDG